MKTANTTAAETPAERTSLPVAASEPATGVKTAHTPGPWQVADWRVCPQVLIPAPDSGWPNGMKPIGAYGADSLSLADARLIASAPDLLAVCKQLSAHMDELIGIHGYNAPISVGTSTITLAARAAIARAEGKQ